MSENKLKILFLCTGNACRSQMAEGWTRYLKNDQIEVWSAGIKPRGLDPKAVQVMTEIGVDISSQQSKHVSEIIHIPFDVVITVCNHARENCPLFPRSVKKIHAGFDDPPTLAIEAKSEEEALAHYRRVRDEIREFVERLPDNLKE
jgi:arsenate reductase